MKSPLQKLDLVINFEGVLHIGGCLSNVSLSFGIKHAVVLPQRCHVTTLVIRHLNEKIHNEGDGMTLNEIRANGYWIFGGMSAVGSYILKCVVCRKSLSSVVEQKMADLPEDHLEPVPPFTDCAVDYFGPFTIKKGRKEMQQYGALYNSPVSHQGLFTWRMPLLLKQMLS